jgi:sulfonate transport system ATP-binding protein
MDQRVVIARAFAIDPDLLLMHEPYCQLDVKLRYYLEDENIRMRMELKKTVIFVTHKTEEVVYVAERILVLTPKPTTIKAEIKVDLPHPRDFANLQFVAIRNRVTEMIKWW